jgi:hypothetical protein
VHLDKALRVWTGFELPHASLPFARRLMRVLRAVVQVPVLSVSHANPAFRSVRFRRSCNTSQWNGFFTAFPRRLSATASFSKVLCY